MATNRILPFAPTDTGSNLLTDTEYSADGQRTTGNQPGTARSKLVNKALRNASAMTAALGQLMADNQGTDITDSMTTAQLVTALKAALSAANIFATAAQFDATTRVATTGFVQRALGNYQAAYPIGSGITLTAADVGKNVTLNVGGFVNLPLGSTVPQGASLLFGSTAAGRGITCQGSDTINMLQSSVTSVLLDIGDTLLLVWNGNQWVAFGGSAQLQFSNKFASSNNANGWKREPNGILTQWGAISSAAGASKNETFPIAFPNACHAVLLTGLNTTGNTQAYAVLNTRSLGGFLWTGFIATSGSAPVMTPTAASVQGHFLAIGS